MGPERTKTKQTKGQKRKLKTKIVAIALGLAASTSLVWSADRPPRETTPTIQGVWQETRGRANCESGECIESPIPALITFYSDGTMTAYDNPPRTGPLDTPQAAVRESE